MELRISFNLKTRLALIRFWYRDKLVGEQQVKAEDLKKVHFQMFNSALLKVSQQRFLRHRNCVSEAGGKRHLREWRLSRRLSDGCEPMPSPELLE